MNRFIRIIFLLFLCNPIISQEDPDFMLMAFEEMDSLKRVALESQNAQEYSFQLIHEEKDGRKYAIDYFCRVEKNQILFLDCSYAYFEKIEGENFDDKGRQVNFYDSTSYSESYFFDKGKMVYCEQYLNDVFYEFQLNDSLDFQRYEGAPWSCHLSFYKGKIFSFFSNGHGLSETDEWEPEAYMRQLYKEHLADIRKKYPKWR